MTILQLREHFEKGCEYHEHYNSIRWEQVLSIWTNLAVGYHDKPHMQVKTKAGVMVWIDIGKMNICNASMGTAWLMIL